MLILLTYLASNLCVYFSCVLFNLVLLYRTTLKAKTYVNNINRPGVAGAVLQTAYREASWWRVC